MIESTGPKTSSWASVLARPHAREHRRRDERAAGQRRIVGRAAARQQLTAVGAAGLDEAEHAVAMLGRDQRAHLRAFGLRQADRDPADARHDLLA